MNEKLIIRQKKSTTIVGCVLSILIMLILTIVWLSNDSASPVLYSISMIILILLLAGFLIDYFGFSLIVVNDQFICRSIFKHREFTVKDIVKVEMRYPFYCKQGILVLKDANDQCLVKLHKDFTNLDKLVAYLQMYVSFEFLPEIHIKKNDFVPSANQLIVQPNKWIFTNTVIWSLGFIIAIIVSVCMVLEADRQFLWEMLPIWLVFFITACAFPIPIICMQIHSDIMRYRYFCLVLTTDDCCVIDERNCKHDFKLKDIKEIKIYNGRNQRTLHIELNGQFHIPTLKYDYTYDNVKQIIPFVEKHLNQIVGKYSTYW